MTIWVQRTGNPIATVVYPVDKGNGRFGLSETDDDSLRFIDLDNGRFGISTSGLYVGDGKTTGRFTPELEGTATAWTERTVP